MDVTFSVRRTFEKLFKASGIERKKAGTRYDKAIVYGFRKRFNGILKMNNHVNSNIAEKLMAHKNGLDGHYLKPTMVECFREFKKAIPFLTISNEERQKIKIEKLEQKKTELERKEKEIENLKENMEKMVEKKIGEYNQKFMENIEKMYDEQILASKKRLDAMDRAFEKKLDEIDRN